MPDSCREQVFQAFLVLLASIAGYTTIRNLDRELRDAEYPAILLFDGGEDLDRDLQSTGLLALRTRAAVQVCVKAANLANVGPALNEGLAKVRQAIAGDPQLAETASNVEYDGADDPDISGELSGDVGRASIQAGFTIVRQESELDPYSFF